MFTGIIETIGQLVAIEAEKNNLTFTICSSISDLLKIDQSIAHDGVCLTVVDVGKGNHKITAISETLSKTTLGSWEIGKMINLERCITNEARLDGHIVQGHVDTTAELIAIEDQKGSWLMHFRHKTNNKYLTIEKGSICVNGISLTIVSCTNNTFSVAIIPYTWENTNLSSLKINDKVNLEFDVMGKYFVKMLEPYLNKLKSLEA